MDLSCDAVDDVTDKIHHVPCVIKLDGSAPVSHYFKPKLTGRIQRQRLCVIAVKHNLLSPLWVEVDGLNVKEAYFRGRKLQGATVSLPDGYSGFVIGKKTAAKRKACDTDEEMTCTWQANAKFQNITFWNHDNLPSKEDAFLRAFHWFDLAKALHKPVTAEDIESATNPGATTTTD